MEDSIARDLDIFVVLLQTEQREKNSGRPLPKPLLHRVRELASLHPYPRKDTSRSSSLSIAKKGAGGRNVRRRSSI